LRCCRFAIERGEPPYHTEEKSVSII
jgi:hypothetical protein